MTTPHKQTELERFLRRAPESTWVRVSVATVSLVSLGVGVTFLALTVYIFIAGSPTEGAWAGFWNKERISFLVNIVGSFAGSLPIIGLGFVTISRIKSVLQGGSSQPVTTQGVLDLMAHNLGKKLVFIRFGYFKTTSKEYKSVMQVAHGQDHIWDYHIHIAPFNWREPDYADEVYLNEFFSGDTDKTCEIKVLNSYLVDVRPQHNSSSDRFGDLVQDFKLQGLTDVLITAVYLNADRNPEDGLVPFERLHTDQLLIENIAFFLQERPHMGTIKQARYEEFLERLRAVADPDIPGTIRILFPGKGLPAESVRSTELKKKCIDLRHAISERRRMGDDAVLSARAQKASTSDVVSPTQRATTSAEARSTTPPEGSPSVDEVSSRASSHEVHPTLPPPSLPVSGAKPAAATSLRRASDEDAKP